MPDWYEQCIEEGVRDIVKLLRDNGFNTMCSCHHEMLIQAENYDPSEIDRLYELLVEFGCDGFLIQMVYCKDELCGLRRFFEIYLDPRTRRSPLAEVE